MLNLDRFAIEFERRGFQRIHSLKYIEQNDLEIILNSPQTSCCSRVVTLEKEIEEIKRQFEQESRKANGRRGKSCTRCHQPAGCTNPTCKNMNSCGEREKHPERKSEIMELQKLDLQRKVAKA